MSDIRTRGIVIKRSDYGDNNCILSIFTPDRGIIKAVIYGVKRGRNKSKAASGQFLCYGEYYLYQGKGDIASVNSVNIIDAFLPISQSIAKLALCNYMADTVWRMLGENNADERLFGIFMNSIYALAYRDDDMEKVKMVFELKLMCAEGYMPVIDSCVICGSRDNICRFSAEAGGVVCSSCSSSDGIAIGEGELAALRYITGCADRRMLAFNSDKALIERVGRLSEKYLLVQTDTKFSSLDYYKAVKDI